MKQRIGGGRARYHLYSRILALVGELDGAVARGDRIGQPPQCQLQSALVAGVYRSISPIFLFDNSDQLPPASARRLR